LSSINLIWVRELNRQDDLFMGKGLRLFDPLILKGTAKCGKIHPSGIEKESRSIPAVRPVLRILWLGLIFMLFLAGTEATRDFPLTGDDPVIRDAASYLLSCQKEDGGFGNEPDAATSSIVPTADAAMALALTGDISRAKEGGNTPLDYLVANPPAGNSSGGSLGRYVMGIVAAGGDPRDVSGVDYVEKLKDLAKPPYGDENLFSESYILLGLAAAGESESSEAQAFISYVLDKQHSSGGWGWGGGSPDLDTTGIATIALLAAGEAADSQPIQDAIEHMSSQQNDDGGFPSSGMSADSNAISDGWAMMALNAAGVDPAEWRKGTATPATHLLSCQQESGVFWWKPDVKGAAGFLVEETSYSIIALMGKSLPITAAARGAEAEGATVSVTVLGDGDLLFSRDLAIGAKSSAKDGFEISNPTVLGALAATGLTYSLADPEGKGRPTVSDLEGYGAPIYFVDGARQTDPIGEYNLTGDECVVISAPDTVLPLRLTAPDDVVEGTAFTIEVASEDLDDRGLIVSAPVDGATVTVKSDTISADYTTDEDGKTPEITLKEPGEYRVEAKKDGYIATFYLNCGYQIINCRSSQPVDVTIHVLGNAAPLFSGEVEVTAVGFEKDGYEIENPTALGALEVTRVSYSLGDPWGGGSPAVTDLAGLGMPVYFVNGASPNVGLDEYFLSDGDWITVTAPYTVYPLKMTAPADVIAGERFKIKVESEEYDASWNKVMVPQQGATVTIGSETYTTGADGYTSDIMFTTAGEYRVRADKPGYISTYYLTPGGYHIIACEEGEIFTVAIHVLGNGNPLFSGEVDVGSVGFEKDGYHIDNPTAMGALDVTGVSYTLGDPWGMGSPAVTDLAGKGMPVYYVDGGAPSVGLDQYYLNDGDWITVSAPYTVYPLKMTAPTDVIAGERFKIKVESEEYDASWNPITIPQQGATVTVGSKAYTTGADGYTGNITLPSAGEYKVKADKAGYIGTYYLTPGGYQIINCLEAGGETVTIHVLGNGNPLFSDEIFVSNVGFEKDEYEIDNPTAMGALDVTGVSYTLGDPWGGGSPAITNLAGLGMPVYYVDGVAPSVGLDEYFLSDGNWITVSAPYTVYSLKMTNSKDATLPPPDEVVVGDPFKIKVVSEEYDATWNLVTVPQQGATVTVGSKTYTTGVDGNTSNITLTWEGEYKVKASKPGHIGTYYLTPGGYHIITATGEIDSDLIVTKKADKNSANPGEILNYTITICNDYPYAVKDVRVTDDLPEESSFEYADPWPNSTDGNHLEWNLPEEMPAGGCQVISLRVKVDDKPPSGLLENCIEVMALDENDDPICARGCSRVFVGITDPLIVTKTADKESVERGKKVKYSIEVHNIYAVENLNEVTVKDAFSRDVEFITAEPAPVQKYDEGDSLREIVWIFDQIKPGDFEDITLEVLVPEMQDFEFGMEQSVSGEGFVNAANDYSTTSPNYNLNNVVIVTAVNDTNVAIKASDSANVEVTDPGTELSTREHGSGSYESEDLVTVKTEDKSIEMAKDVSATFATTALGLYNNRSVTYSSRWTETACGKNRITGTTMSEAYRYATAIDRDSYFKLDETGTSMAFDSEFEGMGSFRVFQKPTAEGDQADFESEETYSGSFKVRQVANGSSIKYEKSASGTGLVAADKRIGDEQRSYESGSGAYDSDEIIEAATDYIAKEIRLAHQPTSFDLGGGLAFNNTAKWEEGIWSKNESKNRTTFIGEKFSSLDRLDKETVVRGLGDVATEAEFSGMGRFRMISIDTGVNVSENETVNSSTRRMREAEIEIDDLYSGDYSIERRVVFAGDFEYDRPHLSAEKSGEILYSDDAILARYNITLINDGNRALGPLFIRDLFPPGAEFVNASERTSRLSDGSAEWTFANLGLGRTLSITMWLDVTDCRTDEIVNRLEASAGYNGNVTTAVAFSAMETNWLSWHDDASVTATKTGEADPATPNLVTYTLTISNLDEDTKAAKVTDILPEGMRFLDSSPLPSSIDGNAVTWSLIEIGPYEAETIVYGVEALRSGRFFNRAIVEASSVNGSGTPPVRASSVVEIDEFEGELPQPIWHPPDWGFEYMEYSNNLTCEEIVNLSAPEMAGERGEDRWTVEARDETVNVERSGSGAEDGAAGEEEATDSPRFDEVSGNLDLAVSYLITCQNEDGGFGPQPGEDSTLASTSLAAIALAAAGMDPASQFKGEKSTADYLIESAPDLANSSNVEAHTGRYVVALVSAGLDPVDIGGTDYVEILRGYSKPSGEIGKEKYIWDDGWVLLGLAAAGEVGSPEASRAAIYLKGLQTASGGWAWHGGAGGEDPDTTGLIVSALLAVGEDESSESVRKALEYFRSEQNDDGGFSSLGSNSATDDWAIMALNGAGEAPEGWRRGSGDPLSHLASLQKEDGSIWWKADSEGSSFEWTALGIVAMSGEAIPPDLP